MKSKATFLTYLCLGETHTTIISPPWDRKKKCNPPFTSEKRALNFITKVGRAWKKDGYSIKVGILRIDAVLPPFLGNWSTMKQYGITEVKL